MRLLTSKDKDTIYFKLFGELDDRSSKDIRAKMDSILDSEMYSRVVFDFHDLLFMDSTGIGVLIGRYKRLKVQGIPIFIKNPNRQVDKILTTTGIYQIIKKIS